MHVRKSYQYRYDASSVLSLLGRVGVPEVAVLSHTAYCSVSRAEQVKRQENLESEREHLAMWSMQPGRDHLISFFTKPPTETGMISAKMWWCFLSWGELITDIVCWQLKTKWQSVKVQVKSKATQLAVLLEINQFLKHEKDSQEGPAAECYFAEMK